MTNLVVKDFLVLLHLFILTLGIQHCASSTTKKIKGGDGELTAPTAQPKADIKIFFHTKSGGDVTKY
ncbi:CLUMA_CG010950, isoform A [Clunio marinus]|uniref:CLUMA_CG010950, isoform A n=1 Tax=Clunio marinus TaxID=568069 RepID=A0A1J1IDC7_9DIPT|nr:CLUMA_CG010950, isoform A [Clunio marinus]